MLSKRRYSWKRHQREGTSRAAPRKHTAHIACVRKESGSHKRPTQGGLARVGCCSAFSSLAACQRRKSWGNLKTRFEPDESAKPKEFARQKSGGFQLPEVKCLKGSCGGRLLGSEVQDRQGTHRRKKKAVEAAARRCGTIATEGAKCGERNGSSRRPFA
jgi:hypothetical protein